MSYTDTNAETIDRWIQDNWEGGIPLSHEAFLDAKNGKWSVLLTPLKSVPQEWFVPYLKNGKLNGTKILGLASGGGQQMAVFSALGAECTVMDYSEKQLESDRMVSARENYTISAVKGDMTKPFPFPNENFDLIFYPVSNCYIEDVLPVWKECFRVLKNGGVLLAGFDNGYNFMVDDTEAFPAIICNRLPFNPLKNPEQMKKLLDEDNGVQFSHSIEEQIGGQLKAGLYLTDIYEDFNSKKEVEKGISAYWATRAIKPLSYNEKTVTIMKRL